jgi:hypothetical protein
MSGQNGGAWALIAVMATSLALAFQFGLKVGESQGRAASPAAPASAAQLEPLPALAVHGSDDLRGRILPTIAHAGLE